MESKEHGRHIHKGQLSLGILCFRLVPVKSSHDWELIRCSLALGEEIVRILTGGGVGLAGTQGGRKGGETHEVVQYRRSASDALRSAEDDEKKPCL